MTFVGHKLFVFGGYASGRYFNDMWAFGLCCAYSPRFHDPFYLDIPQ
jgi:Kelch motif